MFAFLLVSPSLVDTSSSWVPPMTLLRLLGSVKTARSKRADRHMGLMKKLQRQRDDNARHDDGEMLLGLEGQWKTWLT